MPASDRLDSVFAALLARREAKSQLRRLTLVPAGSADFSSNAYLSLSTHPEVQRGYLTRIQAHLNPIDGAEDGNTPALLGSGGSRLLDGNVSLAESLERDIAAFHGGQAGLLFNSGFDANVGLFSCVPQPGDVIVYDELIHASVHDGMKMSRAGRKIAFAHNTVHPIENANGDRLWDETARGQSPSRSLSEVLSELTRGEEGKAVREGTKNVFIAVEGIYSMDGDLAPLKEIVECVERQLPHGNGLIIVDEAHSTGILGDRGRGLVSIVLCSQITRSYLINYARSLIYTTAMPFTALASIQTAYNFIMDGRSEPLLRHLWSLIDRTHQLLQELCSQYQPEAGLLYLSSEKPKSPIIPLFTSNPRGLALHCQQRGFMVRPIVAPTVPAGSERVRICIHGGNTIQQIEGLVSAIERWLVTQIKQTENKTKSGIETTAMELKSRL
ncbi:8-amino-7-oxononanoate synthase [Colletotrichum sp. SAR 10_76]|nr:8-amino-7-oxononanoate synthase [Colletotrichum sp. SAR 10_76]